MPAVIEHSEQHGNQPPDQQSDQQPEPQVEAGRGCDADVHSGDSHCPTERRPRGRVRRLTLSEPSQQVMDEVEELVMSEGEGEQLAADADMGDDGLSGGGEESGDVQRDQGARDISGEEMGEVSRDSAGRDDHASQSESRSDAGERPSENAAWLGARSTASLPTEDWRELSEEVLVDGSWQEAATQRHGDVHATRDSRSEDQHQQSDNTKRDDDGHEDDGIVFLV